MNISGYEIERRFLLKKEPNVVYDQILDIEQYYTPEGRFRKQKGDTDYIYFKTNKKSIRVGVNEEIEVEITEEAFLQAIKTATKKISKRRGVIHSNGFKWEIDNFLTNSFIIAEVEVDTLDQLTEVVLPSFIEEDLIIEVTPFKEFSNYNLANKI